jgi:hypothetical protein
MTDGEGSDRPPISVPDEPTVFSEPVPLESTSTTPVEIPTPGGDVNAQLERENLARDYEGRQHARELGWLGKPFGGKNEKPGNISAAVVILCFSILGLVWLTDTAIDVFVVGRKIEPLMPFERIFSGLTAIITLVLGYLFGSNDKDVK